VNNNIIVGLMTIFIVFTLFFCKEEEKKKDDKNYKLQVKNQMKKGFKRK
jgi:hypothetical protein